MAKKKIEKAEETSFEDIDKIISKQFGDLIDLSKVDTSVDTFYDWGVYSLNYICSKNLFGGIPKGRVTGIEGLAGTGKSLLTAVAAKDPRIDYIIVVETEGGGQGDELMTFAGVDKRKVRIMKANTFTSYKTNKKTLKIEEIKDSEIPKKLNTDTYLYTEGITSKIRRFIQAINFGGVKQNILIILDSLANIQSVRALAGGCYIGDTKITTKNGLKSIKDIKEGDFVLTHLGSLKEVEKIHSYENKNEIIEIEIEDEIIKLTPNHKLLIKRDGVKKWEMAGNVLLTDELFKI